VTDYLRLALATLLVLLPGRLIARALGQRGTAATLAWALAAQFVAWSVVFLVHGTVWLAIGVLAAIAVAAGLAGARIPIERTPPRPGIRAGVVAGGVVLGLLLWHVSGIVAGDGLFHLARVRKLVALGHLHLRSVDELAGGGLHPGYAFPLWHGMLATIAKLSGLDPGVVVRHEASLLAPIACLVAWEAGVAVFDSATAGLAVLAGQLGLYAFAAGHGGAYAQLALPGTAARQILVPAGIALFFLFVRSSRLPDAAALAAIFGALALVHVTYAVFAVIPLAAYALVRFQEWRVSGAALVAAGAPVALAVLWLRPLLDETVSHNPGTTTLAAGLAKYADELDVWSQHRYRVAPELVGRSGAVAVAALVLVPLAALAARRRWSAYVLGGTVAILALMLVPTLFVHLSNAASLSQSRRAAGFVPFTFAFAGGLGLLARSWLLVPLGLLAGIAVQHYWPGDFAYGLRNGGPATATWIAFVGGAIGLAATPYFRRRRPVREWPTRAAVAAWLFVLPVAVHGFRHWTPLNTSDRFALSPALVRALAALPAGAVVIADPTLSYRIAAAAPVYVVAAPPEHVADTHANNPYARVREVRRWLATDDPAVPRRYHATWAVKNGRLYRLAR
jgi:hypothetical protein